MKSSKRQNNQEFLSYFNGFLKHLVKLIPLFHYSESNFCWVRLRLVFSIWKKNQTKPVNTPLFLVFLKNFCQLRFFGILIAAVLTEVVLSGTFFDWKFKICRFLRCNCLVWPNIIFIDYQNIFLPYALKEPLCSKDNPQDDSNTKSSCVPDDTSFLFVGFILANGRRNHKCQDQNSSSFHLGFPFFKVVGFLWSSFKWFNF